MDDSTRLNAYLQQISQQLSADDMEYLKFLCEWVIPESSRRMESVRSGVDLFQLLKDEGKLSTENLAFLQWILASIRRGHLLDGYSQSVAVAADPPLSVPQRFADCLVQVAQSLKSEDMGELQFHFRRKLQMHADWKPLPTELFLELRRQSLLKESDVSTLTEALRNTRRLDLITKMDQFLVAQLNKEVEENLEELRNDFFHLINGVEDALTSNNIGVEVLMKRFRMLPQAIRRQQEMDRSFSDIRQRALKSTTINELFNNLTELKHWSFITPEILTHIIQDVKEVHFDVAVYESKLSSFKTRTKVKDLIGLEFLLPDFYVELRIKVRGWQEKTINDADTSVCTLLARSGYQNPKLGGLQCAKQGCVELTYVLLESINAQSLTIKELHDTYENYGILSISINQDMVYNREEVLSVKGATGASTTDSADVASRQVDHEWYGSGSLEYSVQGGRDVLIIESDLPLPNADVECRRPADLMDADRQKLKSQGVSSDELHEASIIRARYEYDKRRTLFRVLRSELDHLKLQRQEVFESIIELFEKTKNDGVIVYYIGAGRRGTGDWCFEDGFITFRDITQLYLTHLKCRVLTIVSDCSYSGCWVRDCMEFLDEQGGPAVWTQSQGEGDAHQGICFMWSHPNSYAVSVFCTWSIK